LAALYGSFRWSASFFLIGTNCSLQSTKALGSAPAA